MKFVTHNSGLEVKLTYFEQSMKGHTLKLTHGIQPHCSLKFRESIENIYMTLRNCAAMVGNLTEDK